jgi:hypothetical protein
MSPIIAPKRERAKTIAHTEMGIKFLKIITYSLHSASKAKLSQFWRKRGNKLARKSASKFGRYKSCCTSAG